MSAGSNRPTSWLPCFRACCARRSQHLGRSMLCVVSNATSRLPHSIARSRRVLFSWTKCTAIYRYRDKNACLQPTNIPGRYTSGKPFCCKYAMIFCPRRLDVRTMYSISSWLLRRSASLKQYSVGSIVIVRGRADRSRQWTVLPLTRVRYTGLSNVQITPWSLHMTDEVVSERYYDNKLRTLAQGST